MEFSLRPSARTQEQAAFEARFEKLELIADGVFAGDCFVATKQTAIDGRLRSKSGFWSRY
jgi:hypothetical protein